MSNYGHIPDGWMLSQLGDIANIRRGASPRPIQDPKWFSDKGPGWVRISDVTKSRRFLRKTVQCLSPAGVACSAPVKPGDVIMSICATIGEPLIVDMDACIHDGFVVFTEFENALDRTFLTHELRFLQEEFRSMGQTGTQANLNTGIVSEMTFPVPPLPEQRKIVDILGSVDENIETTQAMIAKLQDLKKASMRELLTKGIGHTKFKNSSLGKIPDEWEVVKLLDCVIVIGGQVNPILEPYCDMPLVAPDHVESGTGRLLRLQTAKEQGAISGKYLFEPNDVIYSKIRPYLKKAIIVDFAGLCSADMYALRAGENITPSFLFATVLGEQFSRFAESVSMRSGIPKINREEFSEYCLPLPPLSEQTKISDAIVSMDRRITDKWAYLSKLFCLKKALMQVLLTGKVRVKA